MHTRKSERRAVRASNLNASIGKSSAPMIVPSTSTSFDAKQVAANAVECGCGDCGFKFQSVSSIGKLEFAPICANCGSGNVNTKKVQTSAVLKSDAVMAAVQCPKCSTYQIQESATAEAMAAGYHCVTCGEEQILTPDLTQEDETDVVDETPEVSEVGEDDEECAAEEAVPADDTSAPAAPAGVPTPSDSTDPVVAETEPVVEDEDSFGVNDVPMEEEPVVPVVPVVAEDTSLDGLSDDTSELDDLDLGDDSEDFPESEELSEDEMTLEDDVAIDSQFPDTVELDAEENGDQVEFEMLPEEDNGDTELSFVYVGDKLNAFANNLHVATLSKETAGKNADLFNSDVLVRSIVAQCRESGIRKGLQSSGFKIIKVSLPIQALVAKRVKAALATVKAAEVAAVKSTSKDWQQSMAIALAGLNKNFFAGKDHPLRASLVTELSALGVRNPTKMLDKVFAAHGAKFNSAVMELASEIQAKPLEVRNQLAQTLDSANYMATAEIEGDEDFEEDDDIEQMPVVSRLNGSGHRIVKSAVQTASAKKEVVSSGSKVASLIAGAGGSLFLNTRS